MAYQDNITTSKHGRRLGLQRLSSGATGGSETEFLVGPEAFRVATSTSPTTSENLKPYGYDVLPVSSVGSSQVYTVDPPIPGAGIKVVRGSTVDAVLLNTANATISASAGSSFATVKLSSLGYGIGLIPLTTALWLSFNASTAAGHTLSETT